MSLLMGPEKTLLENLERATYRRVFYGKSNSASKSRKI